VQGRIEYGNKTFVQLNGDSVIVRSIVS